MNLSRQTEGLTLNSSSWFERIPLIFKPNKHFKSLQGQLKKTIVTNLKERLSFLAHNQEIHGLYMTATVRNIGVQYIQYPLYPSFLQVHPTIREVFIYYQGHGSPGNCAYKNLKTPEKVSLTLQLISGMVIVWGR